MGAGNTDHQKGQQKEDTKGRKNKFQKSTHKRTSLFFIRK
jgi:hypothetical protein